MRLIDFISGHHDAIVGEWESFARTLLPGAEGMTGAGLRDHARAILTAIARDMESRQSPDQEEAKSKGEKTAGHLGALGELHAVLRIESGFSLTQVVAEYRALRASILRLWGTSHSDDPEGVLRFNEAIDEALSEAVTRYAEKMTDYRDEVTAFVSRDLLDPVNAILLDSAALFGAGGLDDRTTETVTRIQNGAKRMNGIIRDVLDLTQIRLGFKLSIVRKPTDAGAICTMVIAEFEGANPNAPIRYVPQGDLHGEWDMDRLARGLSNIVGNALRYGDPNKPIGVAAKDDGEDVVISVHNEGPPISQDDMGGIFEPLVRRSEDPAAARGLGLGLYIANQVVVAHGGRLEATSTEADGTTFTVRLPRQQPSAPPSIWA